ncbi:MAG TPA: hypothetical protein VFT45_09180 [Longimicrobium sp.]|nr:hypothetical protein [Longimicrobium sp.]
MCDPIDEEWTEADDVIEEVRAARRALWAQFDNDPVKMVAYLMEKQKLHADRLWDPRTRDKQDKSAA